jgi:hypothetical protein
MLNFLINVHIVPISADVSFMLELFTDVRTVEKL